MLEVRLLGTFTIKCDGKPVTISSRAAQSLFAYFILNAGTSHRREKLAGMVWPDATEEKAHAYLRHELWRLRKALSSKSKVDYLVADAIHISFNSSSDYWSDVSELKNANEAASIEELMEVLSVAQGELLPGFYDEWIILERQYLQAIYEKRMARLLEWLEHEKRWGNMLEWAERWISLGQGPEAAYRALMIAYDGLEDRTKVASTYQRCVDELRKLDLEPSDQTRALAFKRNSSLNIPIPLTSFVGREKELKEVAALLSKSRLVTLTGSGGVGKTRLAIQAVADILELFPDGVWFLDLAPLSDPALVPNTLANLLGLRESVDAKVSITDLIISYFRSRTALVVFDNCEHLIESSARLVHLLLTSCECVSVLATSREGMRVSGELTYRVPSLEIPSLDSGSSVEELADAESVKLFMERAAVASQGFSIDFHTLFIIVEICRRLDGIPLAIELAATRVNTLAVEQILKRLDNRFNLLKGGSRSTLPRYQTLRATVDWSYDLLSEKERLLFRRLAVFGGGWTLEAAEEVCSGNGLESHEVLDLLCQLANKSLLVVENVDGKTPYQTGRSPRYRGLETIRQFAREKLYETAENLQLQDKQLAYFLKLAEEIQPYLAGAKQSEWMDSLEVELDNFRLALEWSISNKKGDDALGLFAALGEFWIIRCYFQEGIQWFRRTMELREGVAKSIQANALSIAGALYWIHESIPASRIVLRESINFSRKIGDMKELANTLLGLGVVELSLCPKISWSIQIWLNGVVPFGKQFVWV